MPIKDEKQIHLDEKITQAKQEYDALFDLMNDGLFIINSDASIKKVNQKAADIFGYTIEELENLSVFDINDLFKW